MSKVKISTDKGDMIAELYDNETPITVNNFLKLIGEKFYDGLNFHRVIPGFVAQGGCPNKRGDGGPGYTIQCEVSAPKQFHDTGGSQFFICHNRQGTQHLDGNHTCFGKVIEGVEVIHQIQPGTNINSITVVE